MTGRACGPPGERSEGMGSRLKRIFSLNPLMLSVILVVILAALYGVGPRFLEVLEYKALDIRFLMRGPVKPGPEVVLAVIDEKSVDKIGRWPWPRSRIAELVSKLSQSGAKAVALDIGFFEPDTNTNLTLIERLDQEIQRMGVNSGEVSRLMDKERELADFDRLLARTIKDAGLPVILGYFFHINQDDTVAHISPEEVQAKIDAVVNSHYAFVRAPSEAVQITSGTFLQAYMPEANIPPLTEAAAASGYFNMFPDADGTVRWVPMVIQCRDKYYMPLSLQALRSYLGGVPASLDVTEVGLERVAVGDLELPTDEVGRLLVNYRGPAQTFPHFPVADILDGETPADAFKDKIVLVGPTAVGIYDLRVTPFDSVFPGVEIHANVMDNILHKDFLVRPNWTVIYDLASIVFIGLVLGLALPRLSAFTGPLLGIGLLSVWTAANYYFFLRGIWVNIIYPVMTLILVYTAITIFRYMTEEREKKKIKGAFSSYVNPSVVQELLKNPDMLKLGGDKRIATVLFSDIRGFTTISEKLDPEDLVSLLNRYLTAMTDLVFKYDGLLDKYIGDAIMAVWGAPLSQPEHAFLACRTSLEMLSELDKLRQELVAENPDVPYLDIGIGVNSGPMVVGNMGSQSRMDYTAMGDSVNLGSRLEGANKQYGTNIIIGEMTFEQVKDRMYCRELDSVAVKGKDLPVRIFELMGEVEQVSEDKIKLARAFARGLAAYKAQQWDKAERTFAGIRHYFPDDKPTQMYLARVAELRDNPPPRDWDGVFVMKTK